jgi:glycosyltransferase involved in cell wall biosynthesis
MNQRQIWLPSDVFPPRCGGAGWSAHALATALQAHGEQVTAFVPRGSQATHIHTIDQIRTVEVGISTAPLHILQEPLRVATLRQRMRQHPRHQALTIIHAQHIVSAKAAIPLKDAHTRVIITVRDHWPWDMRATGMQMQGDQRTWAGMQATLRARQAPIAQRILAGAYLVEMRARAQLLAHADAVIAVSEHMAARIRQHVPTAQVYAIPNMVDGAQVTHILAHPPTIPLPERFALFVGKLEPNKGAELLPALIERIRPPALVVAGTGTLHAQIMQAAHRADVPCLLLDWVDHNDVLRLMARCEALWFPSSWDEPLSRTLLEGLACGAPIVAMPTGGTPEIILDGNSGFLAGDVAQFAHMAQRLHDEPALRVQLAQGARQRATAQFSPAVVIRAVQALYDEIGERR